MKPDEIEDVLFRVPVVVKPLSDDALDPLPMADLEVNWSTGTIRSDPVDCFNFMKVQGKVYEGIPDNAALMREASEYIATRFTERVHDALKASV